MIDEKDAILNESNTEIIKALEDLANAYSEGRVSSIEIPEDAGNYFCDCSEDCR